MTYKEWFTRTTTRFGIEAADVELILTNQQATIPDANAEVDVTTAKKALCKEFGSLIPLANVSEGGYSVSWNWEAIKFWYKQTCGELGITPLTTPKVRNRSNRW
ncbi:MAG: hypothetical protein IKU23_08770 [Clostridia bacterium]|jgi:hypothetical protein|nr:hypothetical protein [Clostridia bacterium]